MLKTAASIYRDSSDLEVWWLCDACVLVLTSITGNVAVIISWQNVECSHNVSCQQEETVGGQKFSQTHPGASTEGKQPAGKFIFYKYSPTLSSPCCNYTAHKLRLTVFLLCDQVVQCVLPQSETFLV